MRNPAFFLAFFLSWTLSITLNPVHAFAPRFHRRDPPLAKASLSTLKSCLSGVSGNVVYKGDSSYSEDIKDENSAVQFFPVAILFAADVKDVQTAVKCASSLKLAISARSGGHSYEGYSLGGKNGALVVDLTALGTIDISKTAKTAKIGTGSLLGQIYYALTQSGFVIPAGSCPSVGIAGHSMGGGYGLYSRKYGLATDSIVSAEMVDATGNLVTATAKNPASDLLFALRGAGGGSYGIVTSITFKLQPVPPTVTSFVYTWSADQVHQLVPAVAEFAKQGTPDVTFSLVWSKDGFTLQGVYIGNESGVQKALDSILTGVPGSTQQTLTQHSFFDSVVFFSETDADSVRHPKRSPYNFKAKSFFVGESGLSSDAIDDFSSYLASAPCHTYAILDVLGGAINTVPSNATAFVHRNMLIGIQLITEWNGESGAACVDSVNTFGGPFQRQHTTPFSYQNYIDRDQADWQHAYYGDNLARLVTVKNKYDPNNLFNFPQSIPTRDEH